MTAAQVDAIAREIIEDDWSSGMVIGAAIDGRVVLERAYGLADREAGVPVTPETVFHIGSITKQFTAAAVLRLVDDGALALDDDLAARLPSFPTPGVTIRQVLSHTGGVHDYTSDPAFLAEVGPAVTADAIAAYAARAPLDFAPGSRWRYSNSGYVLLGKLIEHVSGSSYADFVAARLLAPAHLAGIAYSPDELAAGFARGYVRVGGALAPARAVHMAGAYAAGALCATARALLGWADQLFRGLVVSPASVREMARPATLADGTHAAYGLGLQIDKLEGHLRIGHSGRISGFSAELAYYPSDKLTVVVLTNTEGAGAAAIDEDVARVILGFAPCEVADLPLDDDARRWLGDYVMPDGVRATVAVEDDRATIVFPDDKVHLAYQGAGQFHDRRWRDVAVTFTPHGFTIAQRGAPDVVARRVGS